MNFFGELRGFATDLAQFHRDIEVSENQNRTGREVIGVQPENVVDQTTIGVQDVSGPRTAAASPQNNVLVGGVRVDRGVLFATAGVLGTLAVVKWVL